MHKKGQSLLSRPDYSAVLHTAWRVKSKKHDLGFGENKRPDFQELLTHIRLAVWLKKGKTEDAAISLVDRVRKVLAAYPTISHEDVLAARDY